MIPAARAASLAILLLAACAEPPPAVVVPEPPPPTVSAPDPATPPPPPAAAAKPPPPQSPFRVVLPHASPDSVFEIEGALLARAGDDLFELSNGAARSRFDLTPGLPSDDCQGISGVVGRFPDAAFALVSWSGRPCGTVFGAHRIYRWNGRSWAPIPPPKRPSILLMAFASLAYSQGLGIVVCDQNAVGDGCGGNFTLLHRVDRAAPTPIGRRVSTQLGMPVFRFSPSGTAFAFGSHPRGGMALERWQRGSTRGEIIRIPATAECTPAGIHVFDDRNIVTLASCGAGDPAVLTRYDGRQFTRIPTTPKAPAAALTGEAGGALWLATGGVEARVYRRSPSGDWTSAPLPRQDAADPASRPLAVSRLVVRGDDVWAIGDGAAHARRGDIDEEG